jgi:ABC-type transporter Mla subunit MlaD
MVLATIIITGILILLFNKFPALGTGSYTIYVRFATAPGVAKDTPVRRSGILIGRVSDVEFDENYNVIVTLRIDGDQKIFDTDEIRITRSLLGDSELEVVGQARPVPAGVQREVAKPETPPARPAIDQPDPAGEQPPAESNGAEARHRSRKPFVLAVLRPARSDRHLLDVLQPRFGSGAPVLPRGGAAGLLVGFQSVAQAQPPIRDAVPQAPPRGAAAGPPPRTAPPAPVPEGTLIEGRVTTTPLESLDDLKDNFQRAADALTGAGNEVGALSRNLNELLERNEPQIDRIINQADRALSSFERAMENVNDIMGDDEVRANLKQTLRDLPNLLQETQRAIAGIEGAMRLVDSNLRNLEGFTEPLGQRGEAIVGNIDSGIARLNELLGQVETFSRSLNSPEGSLGQLIHSREIYDQLNMAAANINDLTKRLRPILEDARIFSDKIARHPGVVIRDAVKPGSGTKWVTPK